MRNRPSFVRTASLSFATTLLTTVWAADALPAGPKTVDLAVRETAGIRRFGYPINALVPFPKGALQKAENVLLMRGQTEVTAQFGVTERWDDGSIRWLAVDWNSSPGPLETEGYQLQYGPDVKRMTVPRGLAVSETADAFQIGPIRFRKDGSPLIESCTYTGNETIGPGKNGLTVTTVAGQTYDLAAAKAMKVELLKGGPVHVLLRYRGEFPTESGAPLRFQTDIEMCNSKSWWKVAHRVDAPAAQLKSISLHTPWRLGELPLVWDFGTGSWTYGALRLPDEQVLYEQRVGAGTSNWLVLLGSRGRLLPYEQGLPARSTRAEGWGHLTSKDVVAFAMTDFASRPGVSRIGVAGDGQSEFTFEPAAPAAQLNLTVYQHFVPTPVQIGAATSPPAMLNPLVARCRRDYYAQCNVEVPADTPE